MHTCVIRALRLIVSAALPFALPAWAAPVDSSELQRCAAIANDENRLACFDQLAGERGTAPGTSRSTVSTQAADAAKDVPPAEPARASLLQRHWGLGPVNDDELFRFRPYRQNYILPVRWSDRPNDRPFRPLLDLRPEEEGLDDVEVKFQLSFKVKAWDGVFGGTGDLWLAYTQQNQWQLYDGDTSRPFRETNYEPEVFMVFPVDFALGGLNGRYAAVGFDHQSNGRSDPLSRSWNRVYAQLGMDTDEFWGGELALTVKPWLRVHESEDKDDNPDIEDYVGRIELQAVYKRNGHVLSALGRNNLRTNDNRSSLLLDWSFPLFEGLRGYVQVFSGYGESLIDYNHSQTTVGAGILLTDLLEDRFLRR